MIVYSPDNYLPGRKTGAHLQELIRKILTYRVSVDDVILNSTRKVTVAEAAMLKLVKAALVKEEPWAIQYILKEVLHNGVEKVEIVNELSPAAKFILEKVGYKNDQMIDVTPVNVKLTADTAGVADGVNRLFD